MRRAGDVECTVEIRRSKSVWKDDIKMDMQECDVGIWAVFVCSGRETSGGII